MRNEPEHRLDLDEPLLFALARHLHVQGAPPGPGHRLESALHRPGRQRAPEGTRLIPEIEDPEREVQRDHFDQHQPHRPGQVHHGPHPEEEGPRAVSGVQTDQGAHGDALGELEGRLHREPVG